MKPPVKRCCPHCSGVILEKSIISWGQSLRALKRRRPPDEKAGSPSGQKGEPAHDEHKEGKNQTDPTCTQLLTQVPAQGLSGFQMTESEIASLALSLYAEALATAGSMERFRDMVTSGTMFPLESAYILGAIHAAMALR
jgi:hypothetical protein